MEEPECVRFESAAGDHGALTAGMNRRPLRPQDDGGFWCWKPGSPLRDGFPVFCNRR